MFLEVTVKNYAHHVTKKSEEKTERGAKIEDQMKSKSMDIPV